MPKTNLISTAGPDKAWMLSFIKNPGRPGYWAGTEVTVEQHDDHSIYKFDLFGSRRVRGEPVPPPCTAKRQIAAREALIATMRSQGLIAEAQA